MDLNNRFHELKAITVISYLIFSALTTTALAQDCGQDRKTTHAPAPIYQQPNPLSPTPENLAAGEVLYQKAAKPLACAKCHGEEGKGSGTMAKGMNPSPRDFTCSAMMKDLPDGQLFWVIKNGSKGTGMMPFATLTDDQIWQLILYIRKFSS